MYYYVRTHVHVGVNGRKKDPYSVSGLNFGMAGVKQDAAFSYDFPK